MKPNRGLVFAGVVLLVLGLGCYAAYGYFTGATSDSLSVSSATMNFTIGLNRLTIDATGIRPGDVVQRELDLNVVGTPQMDRAKLTTQALVSSALDTDAVNGLQLQIDACSQPWDETLNGGGVPIAYGCSGATTALLAQQPIIETNTALALDLTPGATNYLVLSIQLPDTADNSFRHLASTIQFAFIGVQPDPGFR